MKCEELRNVPRDRLFTSKLSYHLKEGLFGLDKFEHTLKVYLSTEEIGMNELAGRRERTLLVDEACNGAWNGSKGIIVHGSGERAVLWLRTQKKSYQYKRCENTNILFYATVGEVLRPFPGQ